MITERVRLAGRHTRRLAQSASGTGDWGWGRRPFSWFCESQGIKVQGDFLGKAENKILNAMYCAAGM